MKLFKRCNCADQHCAHHFWYKFVLHGHRYTSTTSTSTFRLADRIANKARVDRLAEHNGIAPIKPKMLSKHLDAYCAHTLKKNATSYKDKAVLDFLLETIGDRPISTVTAFHLESWKTARAADVSKSTVNRELNIVRGCFSRAVDWRVLHESPAKAVKGYRVDDQRVRVLADTELQTVLAIEDPFVVLVCTATLESLSRLSALLGIRKEHIGPSWVEMRQKGGAVARVPITDSLRARLLAHCHESGAVFGEGALGIVPTQQTATNRVLRAFEAAGILNASHHTMRHTGVTLMLEAGVNPRVIQKLAGWSSLRMLERYGHARDAETVRAVSGVAAYLDRQRQATHEGTSSESPAADSASAPAENLHAVS